MADAARDTPRVLVPVAVLEGESVSESLADFLAAADVVVLGYHVIPEQTPAEQASLQFEERAQTAVEDLAALFREAGGDVETRVAFTHDRDQTVARVADEVDATATLLPNPVGDVEDVLVPLRGAIDTDRLAALVATLLAADPGTVTLWGIAAEVGEAEAAAAVERASATLRERGLDPARVATETSVADAPIRAIVERSADFDVIVMGEGEESLWSLLLGEDAERVAEAAVAPVLVVRDAPAGE